MHLWLRDSSPRTLVLLTSSEDEQRGVPSRALIFRPGRGSQAIVEFLPKSEVDQEGLVRLSSRPIEGCLGIINVDGDLFLAAVTSATVIGNLRPSAPQPEIVSRIHEVAFFCLNTSRYDQTSDEPPNTPLPFETVVDSIISRDQYYNPSSSQNSVYEHPCAPLKKIFSAGTFYYAPHPYWDLSSRLSERIKRQKEGANAHDMSIFDPRFVWNEFIVRSLLDFRERLNPDERSDLDACQFIILAIQGYVGSFTLPLPAPPSTGAPMISTLALISRLGWKRAGTRFNTRGVDDEGNVANFVESETLFSTGESTFSYIQVRGSVPLFWEQQGLQTFGQKIQITRPQQASQPAFERHFAHLVQEYGATHALNLLGQKESEAALAHSYSQHLKATQSGAVDSADIGITNFDFHAAVKQSGHDSVITTLPRIEAIRSAMERYGFLTTLTDGDEPLTEQRGVFRTNCLDCLDRTNFVQDVISHVTLDHMLFSLNMGQGARNSTTLWGYHRELWAENGDALSRIYAGTGALNTSVTRTGKRTLAGMLSDATKSVGRAYINNFQDKGKQYAIDLLLGNISAQSQVLIYDPVHDSVRASLKERLKEYSSTKPISIFVGTYNVNGRPPSESLKPWLFPTTEKDSDEPDIIMLGFQEIVPLNAQQIIQTDPTKKQEWEYHIKRNIETRANPRSKYIILRSEQLVGTALFVIVKEELTGILRNVEASTQKTGLRGMSGNKGAVAIRLEYHDTSFCFVTAHLAAGHSNVDERNNDYNTIDTGLRFSKGRTIRSHDVVIWAADNNYRIDMENGTVREYAQTDNLEALQHEDQLMIAMHHNAAFPGYKEGPLVFRPTYRYDLHSDNYDTSEKQRIPAWTDRILYLGLPVSLGVYNRAELRGSDHRPVYAVFRADVLIVDSAKKAALQDELLRGLTNTVGTEKLDDKLSAMLLEDEKLDLPPPSSTETKWWDTPEHPNGLVSLDPNTHFGTSTNPFDSDIASTSSSEEELYRLARPMQPTQAPS